MSPFQPLFVLAAVGAIAATAVLGERPAPETRADIPQPEIGVPAPAEHLHVIDRPGLYGVSGPAQGMLYGVVGNSLVRIDAETQVVRAIIREGVRPID